jgi:hypothetical protein
MGNICNQSEPERRTIFTVLPEHKTNYTQADGTAKASVSRQNDEAFSYRSHTVLYPTILTILCEE